MHTIQLVLIGTTRTTKPVVYTEKECFALHKTSLHLKFEAGDAEFLQLPTTRASIGAPPGRLCSPKHTPGSAPARQAMCHPAPHTPGSGRPAPGRAPGSVSTAPLQRGVPATSWGAHRWETPALSPKYPRASPRVRARLLPPGRLLL